MLGRTHLLAGIALGAVLDPGTAAHWGWLLCGSVLPDIDHPRSLVGSFVPFMAAVLPHRGPTHSLLALLACLIVSPWLALGYALHLLLDAVTVSGIPICWPERWHFKIPPGMRTGGLGELLVDGILLKIIAWRAFGW